MCIFCDLCMRVEPTGQLTTTKPTDGQRSLSFGLHLKLCYRQGGHSPVIIKFPDFSLTFLDISSDYLRGIDPRNSSDKN